MTKAQVEKVRAVSRASNGPAWTQWWDEKARVAVIRRLSKRLPMSTDKEENIRAMLDREDDEGLQDVTPTTEALPRPTREQFTADAAPPDQAPGEPSSKGGDNVTVEKSEAVTPAASDPRDGMSSEELDRVEREADKLQRQAQNDDEGSAEATVDLTPLEMPMKDGKPDLTAYTKAVNDRLATIDVIADLAEFDRVNKPVAIKSGGSFANNYALSVAKASKRISG